MNKWVPSWRYMPIDYNNDLGFFENITQTSCFSNNLNGSKVKLRFNNLSNDAPMHIEHVAFASRNRISGKLSSKTAVTLNGSEKIVVEPNSEVYSDDILHAVSCEEDFIVTMYFKEKTAVRNVCITWAAHSWQSVHQTGDFTETEALGFTIKPQLVPGLAADAYSNQFVVGLSDISVYTDDEPRLIALFGDSITHMSYFSDPLITMLYSRFPGRCSVINGGISGNRIQKTFPAASFLPGGGHQFGIAGKDRFLPDLYSDANPDIVFILEGINDCSHSIVFGEPDVPSAKDIFDALTLVAAQAKEKGSTVYVSTLTPFGSFGMPWRDQVEAIRCEYNRLIREGTAGDAWIDLDKVLCDPDSPDRIQAGMDMGDGVHPGWAGGTKMAKAVFEKWFADLEAL